MVTGVSNRLLFLSIGSISAISRDYHVIIIRDEGNGTCDKKQAEEAAELSCENIDFKAEIKSKPECAIVKCVFCIFDHCVSDNYKACKHKDRKKSE